MIPLLFFKQRKAVCQENLPHRWKSCFVFLILLKPCWFRRHDLYSLTVYTITSLTWMSAWHDLHKALSAASNHSDKISCWAVPSYMPALLFLPFSHTQHTLETPTNCTQKCSTLYDVELISCCIWIFGLIQPWGLCHLTYFRKGWVSYTWCAMCVL